MRIAGAVLTMMSVLGGSLGADVVRPSDDVGAVEPSTSYVRLQEVREPRIWLDRGDDPVLQAGDRVRVYYRTDADAYVAVLQIDTDGTTRMLYPRSPTENHYARAGRDYRLLFPRSVYWNVDDRPGIGYFFIVTSPTPFDLSDFRYSYYEGGWDLSAVGSTVYSDPYVAMDEYVARLVPDWEFVDYGLDFLSYNVGAAHEFPRFLCYECHGFRPYSTWNPYRYTCVNFRVVIYNDPYFYPSYRYRADRVVIAGPRNPTRPRFAFKERAVGDPGTPVTVVRQGGPDDAPSVADRSRTDQRASGARVTPPSVVAPPTTTRSPADRAVAPPTTRGLAPSDQAATPPPTTRGLAPSDQNGAPPATTRRRSPTGQDGAPGVAPGAARVTPPSAGDREPRRPTLQRRSSDPGQSPGRGPDVGRAVPTPPRSTPQSSRPSTGRPATPRAQPSPRPSSPRPSTGRPATPRAQPSPRPSSPRPSSSPRSSSPRPSSPRPSTRRPPQSSSGPSSVSPGARSRTPPTPRSGAPARRPARAGPR